MTKTKYKKRRRQNKAGKRNFAIGRLKAIASMVRTCKSQLWFDITPAQSCELDQLERKILIVYDELADRYYRRE